MVDEVLARGLALALSKRKKPAPKQAPSGFLLGQLKTTVPGATGEPVVLTLPERRKHVLAIGATGSGKTNCLLRMIEHEITEKRTCVVIDLRGDLIERVLLRLAGESSGLSERLHLIDLCDDEFITPFNPLSGSGDVYSRAFHLLGVLRRNADSWGIQLEETLRNCLIALAEGGYSLTDLEPLLADPAFREDVLGHCTDPHVLSFFERYDGLSAERKLAWSLPVLNKVTPLLCIPQIRRMLSAKCGFDWSAVLDLPGNIVLVALASHRFHGAAQLLGGLLVSSLQSAVMARASIPESKRNPVTLFIDEFETMASDSFGTIIAEGRRFGLSLVLSHQNLAQVDAGLRQAIRNNVHVQLFFQTGSLDASELANDITTGEPKEAVRQALMSQRVGEAFLVRRGQPSVQIVTPFSPDPKTSHSDVKALRLAAQEAHCTKWSVDAGEWAKHKAAKAKQTEVRHERLPGVPKTR